MPKKARQNTFFKLFFNILQNIDPKGKPTKFGESSSNGANFQFQGFKNDLKINKKFRFLSHCAKLTEYKDVGPLFSYSFMSHVFKTHYIVLVSRYLPDVNVVYQHRVLPNRKFENDAKKIIWPMFLELASPDVHRLKVSILRIFDENLSSLPL